MSQSIITGSDNLGNDIRIIIKQLKLQNQWLVIKKMMKPNLLGSMYYLLRSVCFCFISVFIVVKSIEYKTLFILFLILGMLFTTRSIRSFGNHVHEGMHGNIYKKKLKRTSLIIRFFFNTRKDLLLNDMIAKYILCPLMFYDFNIYIEEHKSHHMYLGNTDLDKEKTSKVITLLNSKQGYNKRFFRLMSTQVFSLRVWIKSVFGDLFDIPFYKGVKIILWWTLLLYLLYLIDEKSAFIFLALWMLSRMTFYHVLKIFCELVDHYNLQENGIICYTRTMPRNLVSFFLHPDNDNYHTAHHIFPVIPMINLHRAHKVLLQSKKYNEGNHFKTYRQIIKSLTKSI